MGRGRIRLFGGLRIWTPSGAPVLLSGRKEQAILAVLALRQGEALTRDKLIEDIYKDEGQAARRRFNTALWRVRKALRAADPSCADWLETSRETIRLRSSRGPRTDLAYLRDMLDDGMVDCDTTELTEILKTASGDLLPGLDTDLIIECRRATECEMLEAAVETGQSVLEAQPLRAQALADIAIAIDPYDERAWRLLMRSQTLTGRRAMAHATYGELETLLRRELAIAPSLETQAILAAPVAVSSAGTRRALGETGDVMRRLDALSHALSIVTGEVAALRAELRRA